MELSTRACCAMASACGLRAVVAGFGVNTSGWACSTRSRRVYMSQ
ncbi:hypothetical protein [Nonomuraea sp. NPDC049400]